MPAEAGIQALKDIARPSLAPSGLYFGFLSGLGLTQGVESTNMM
jgi:hypothetical protein